MRFNRKLVLFAAVAAVCLGSPTAKGGTTYDWDGFGINGNWSTLGNWGGFSTPGDGDEARFGDTSSLVDQSKVDTSRTVLELIVDGPSSVGDYTFTGANTTLTVSSEFDMLQPNPVKDNATIASGLTVNAASVHVDKDSHLTITGGSVIASSFQLTNSGTGPNPTVVIGNGGTLRLANASSQLGTVSAGTLELDSGGALNIDSDGILLATGTASTIALNTNWVQPAGSLVELNFGAHIVASSAFDVATGNNGNLVVDGSGSSVSAGGLGASQWGDAAGNATVTFSHSAVGTYNSGLRIDNNLGGTATVGIFSGARLTVATGLYVGGGSLNSANITLNSGTLAIASGTQSFADFGQGTTFNLQSGGVLQLGGSATFETGSTLNWSGGTISAVGQTLGINGGVASLTFGGLQMNGETLSVANGGHLDSNNYLYLSTTFSSGSGGTLNVSDAGSHLAFSALSAIGYGTGATATATFANSAVGTFSNGLLVGDIGGAATININSNAVLNVASVFQSGLTAGSAATINIAGGTLNSTGTTALLFGTKLTLSSGGLVLGDNGSFASGSTFNWTGGNLSIASGKSLTFDASTGTITTGNGLSNGATIHIADGAHVTNSSYMDVGNSGDGGANGTLLIDGAGSSYITTADIFNYTLFGFNNGDFGTLTISNSGAGTFNGLHLADNGGKALVTVSSGSLNIGTFLQAGGALSTSAATINISGGRLNSTGTALFLGGSVVNITGGSTSFTGAATFLGGTTPDQLNVSNFSAATFSGLSVGSTTVALSSGGTLTSNGSAQFNNGATLTVSGSIGQFTKFISLGNATFLTGSSASVSGFGTFTMSPSTTLAFDGGVGTFSSTTAFDFSLPSGGTLRVTGGGKFFDAIAVDIADGQSSGTLFVDGANSVLSSSSPFSSFWGTNTGNSATATFSTGAAGTFSGLGLAVSGGAATLNVLSNAQLIVGSNGLTAGGSPGTATININGGTLNITGGAGFAGNSFVNYQSGSFNVTGGINTSNTASISVASGAIVRTGSLTMNDTTLINLNGGLIDDYSGATPISTIRGYLLAGRNGGLGGLWKGVGINSSTAAANSTKFAVGYADASAIGSPATFMGQPIDNTSVLVRLAYLGDANLDGKVNAQDFDLLAANYGKSGGTIWTQGDFNYDGVTNVIDFNMLASNFNATPLNAPALGTLVPEPGVIAALAAIGLFRRRRGAQ